MKGIDDEARQAAKLAARKAGMTLGEWLNTKILDSTDEKDDPDRPTQSDEHTSQSQSRQAQQDMNSPSRTAQQSSADNEITARLDSLAGQLSRLANTGQHTAVSRFLEPARPGRQENVAIQALIDRIEASERLSVEKLSRVDARLDNIASKLDSAGAPAQTMPQRPEDVPGFSALESAMRNIVDHIEASETSTRSTLKAIQQRMADMASRAAATASEQVNQNAPALSSLEQRVSELASRLEKSRSETSRELQQYVQGQVGQLAERIDAVRHSTDAIAGQAQAAAKRAAQDEGRQLEERLKVIIGELQGSQRPDPDVARIYAEIESLNQRFDDIKSETASEQDVATLRTAIDQLAGKMPQGSDPSMAQRMEDNLAQLNQRLDQMDTSSLTPQLAELEQRVQALDAQLVHFASQPGSPGTDNRLADQINVVNERLSSTESKLNHLGTIERAIEQLYKSMEENRDWVRQTADDAAQRVAEQFAASGVSTGTAAASPELQALESGLMAVKASAEQADQRTQETLEAVHDTLEQIIDKLAQIDQQAPAYAATPQPDYSNQNNDMADTGSAGNDTAMQPAAQDFTANDPFAYEASDPTAFAEPNADPTTLHHHTEPSLDAGQSHDDQQHEEQTLDYVAPDFPTSTEQAPAEPASTLYVPEPEPEQAMADDGVREDFIAAARRAAQNASSQRGSFLGGLSALSGRSSPTGDDQEKPKKSGSLFSFPFRKKAEAEPAIAELDPAAEKDGSSNPSKRRRQLILAGLVLLAAVSAYTLGGVGKKLFSAADDAAQPSLASQQQTPSIDLTQPSQSQIAGISARSDIEAIPQLQSSGMAPLANLDKTSSTESDDMEAPAAIPSQDVVTASLSPAAGQSDSMERYGVNPPQAASQTPQDSMPTARGDTTATQQASSELPAALGPQALRDAATNGDANAQFVIASRYLDGKTVDQDFKMAAQWYRKAATQGLAPAQYRIGTLYERGRGVDKDIIEARSWYEQAAERHNVKAMHNLAVIYADNDSGKAQFDKAAKWFRAAADHGLKDSLYNLAVLHERGLGVSQDTKQAYFWYGIAARHGDTDAKAKAETLKSFLTTEQKKQLDEKVATWAPQKPDKAGNFVAITDPNWQVAVAAPRAPSQASTEFSGLSAKELVLKAQEMLSGMGYDVGALDGVMGSRTANAIRLFQLQTGMPVNGTVSAELVQAIAARNG